MMLMMMMMMMIMMTMMMILFLLKTLFLEVGMLYQTLLTSDLNVLGYSKWSLHTRKINQRHNNYAQANIQ